MAGIKEKIINLEDLKEAYDDLTSNINTRVSNGNITKCKMWSGTKEEYDALPVKDPGTLYNITNDEGIIGDYLVSAKAGKESITIKNSKDIDTVFTTENKVSVGNIEHCELWTGTKEEFDAIAIKKDNVLYNVMGETTEAQGAMTYKGTCLQADLPTAGQQRGDYYKLADEAPSTYAGQCAIWNEISWDYSSSNITVDPSLSTTSSNPIANKAVAEALNNVYTKTDLDNLLKTLKQAVYDGMFPVGYEHTGITCIGVPEGVTATWTEQTDLNNRYPMVLSTASVKTLQNAVLPKHWHLQLSNNDYELGWGSTGAWTGRVGVADAGGGISGGAQLRTGDAISSTQVDVGLELKPKTYTIKHWKRTA